MVTSFIQNRVEKRKCVIDLIINKMKHLGTINVRCHDRKSYNNDTMKWLQQCSLVICTFTKNSSRPQDIRL